MSGIKGEWIFTSVMAFVRSESHTVREQIPGLFTLGGNWRGELMTADSYAENKHGTCLNNATLLPMFSKLNTVKMDNLKY